MRTTTSVERVFGIAELRELILYYSVVTKSYGEFRLASKKEDIRNYRLVQKVWLESVTNCLRKANLPMFRIRLHQSNSVNGRLDVKQDGKLLSHFVNHIKAQLRISKPVPTFSLKVASFTLSQFNRDVAKPLFKCLELGGNGLVHLELTLPREVELKSFGVQNSSFPRLGTLAIDFNARKSQRQHPTSSSLEISGSVGKFMRHLLAGCSHLNEFHITTPWTLESNYRQRLPVPSGFEFAILPASLTYLAIECTIRNKNLRQLAVNYLPNLYHLNLHVPPTPFEDGLIFKILQIVPNSIGNLAFDEGTPHDGVPKRPTYFRFPLLPNLFSLCTTSLNMELDNGVHYLEKYLPELSYLELENHTVRMFHKWTRTSIFKEMRHLGLKLVDENFDYNDDQYFIDVDHDIITSAHKAFPHLENLKLQIRGADIAGLQYVFKFMTNLKWLSIEVECGSEDVTNSDPWDALLLGISIEEAKRLRETGDADNIEIGGSSSIKNLNNLEKLFLESDIGYCRWGFEEGSLLSDAAFQFGFMQMPNLRNLFFGKDFQASDEIAEIFKGLGPDRTVTCL